MFIEFGGPFPVVTPLARDYRIRIEVKVVHRERWIQLVTFTLRAAHVTDPERYIAYSNSAHDLTEEPSESPRQPLSDSSAGFRHSPSGLRRLTDRSQAGAVDP
jgi:hypothetical protein